MVIMKSESHVKSENLSIEEISSCLNDLEDINSFFILERGNCSYLQCINYNGSILIEERIYNDNGFKHYVLGHKNISNNKNNNYNINKNTNNNENVLIIDDKYFKRYFNELFSKEEAIDIFTDYYSNIPFNNIVKRDITREFANLEKGFVFIQWLESAADNFKESLDEFVEIIEPLIVDELKKDCIGRKIQFDHEIDLFKNEDENQMDSENEKIAIKCSVFKVIDIQWAIESIIEVGDKYEFLDDIILFKKNNINDNEFFKINIGDFK